LTTLADQLHRRLAADGVPVHDWRRPATRSVDDLAREIERGESEISFGPPLRKLRIVRLQIERGGLVLHELELHEDDGRSLIRNRPPAEKLLADEDPIVGALRGAIEELGVEPERVQVLEAIEQGVDRLDNNPGYPGLATEYEIHLARMTIDGLPDTDFETVENETGPGGRRVVHRWGWR
jgi:hypothetical protein